MSTRPQRSVTRRRLHLINVITKTILSPKSWWWTKKTSAYKLIFVTSYKKKKKVRTNPKRVVLGQTACARGLRAWLLQDGRRREQLLVEWKLFFNLLQLYVFRKKGTDKNVTFITWAFFKLFFVTPNLKGGTC